MMIMVMREVINLSNSLSVVESFRSTSGNKEPKVDDDTVINNPDTVVGCIKNNDIRLPQATWVFFSILSPLLLYHTWDILLKKFLTGMWETFF